MLVRVFFPDGAMDILNMARVPVAGDHIAVRTQEFKVLKVHLVATPVNAKAITKNSIVAYIHL